MKAKTAAGAIAIPAGAFLGSGAGGPSLMPWPAQVRQIFPFALGAVAGLGLGAAVASVALSAQAVRGQLGARSVVTALGSGAAVFGVAYAALRGYKQFLGPLFAQGRIIESAFAYPPENPLVSGSVNSLIPLASHGREGARFIHGVTNPQDIDEGIGAGEARSPIRIFVGLDAGDSIEDRVGLAISEMNRTHAWDRGTLLVLSPAGTGYANATPVEALEILTKGDCATVVMGYGLLPSFLSLDRTDVGASTQRALLSAIAAHGFRGRILLYGESLGARVQQRAIEPSEFDNFGIHRALWVGTPGGADASPDVSVRVDHPNDLDSRDRPIWLLEHDADPVVRLSHELAWTRPDWLAPHGPRGRDIPEAMVWRPGVTYAQVLIDTLFATDIRAGDFQSLGHDYRADLAAVTSAAFGFGIDLDRTMRLDALLRQLEIARGARIDGIPST